MACQKSLSWIWREGSAEGCQNFYLVMVGQRPLPKWSRNLREDLSVLMVYATTVVNLDVNPRCQLVEIQVTYNETVHHTLSSLEVII